MENTKSEVTKKVLDYWYIMEFLGQDKFPRWSEEEKSKARKAREEETRRKNATNFGREYTLPQYPVKTFQVFERLEEGMDIYECVKRSAEKYGMTRWGNITLYIGKVQREICIEKFAELLKKTEQRPEKSVDKVAWASLQLGSNGVYVEESFSLSPIIWALQKIIGRGECKSLSRILSEDSYKKEVEQYEERLASFEREGKSEEKQECEYERGLEQETTACEEKIGYELDEEGKYIKKAEYAIPAKEFSDLTDTIYEQYIKEILWQEQIDRNNRNKSIEKTCYLSYRLFLDDEAKECFGEEEYMGLSKTYFTGDLHMVHDEIDMMQESNNPMSQTLIDYIFSGYEEYYGEKRTRVDLLQKKDVDVDEIKARYLDILNVNKAPIGKWPSRFMPALMQQVAINLATEGMGDVFSVNGPPGTGKTTLLKEIIVHNIIERGKLLMEYDDPDKAFISCKFCDGKGKNGAYSKYAPNYYRFIDDRINNYSVLVTSCNNAAVENITKELPLEDGIVKNLKEEDSDSQKQKDGILDVRKMFTVSENQEANWLKEQDQKTWKKQRETGKTQTEKKVWEVDCHDIYFTRYARALLQNENVWGLVAAPLGKKSNIHTFYSSVLHPLEFVIGSSGEKKKERLKEYSIARANFKNQLKIVQQMQENLSEIGKLETETNEQIDEMIGCEENLKKLLEKGRSAKDKYDKRLCILEKKIAQAEEASNDKERGYRTLQREYDEISYKYNERREEAKERRKQVLELEDKIKPIEAFFRTKKVRNIRNLQELLCKEAEEIEGEIEKLKKKKNEYECETLQAKSEWKQKEGVVEKLEAEKKECKEIIHGIAINLEQDELELKTCRENRKEIAQRYVEKADRIEKSDNAEKFVWLNDSFIKDFLCDNEDVSTAAQVSNPWFNDVYNREREKLFYYAMKFHEAFILASKACRENFINLGLLWNERNGDDGKRVRFTGKDRSNAMQPLLQTIFLLVPVVSSTFASISGFLGCAGNGTVGTLIVDEAGQASPQMAVGALYRSRKAIIVGDPKQIEPVVTDDLRLIREAYNENKYKPYIRKNVSVQHFADFLNLYGTWFETDSEYKEWVGTPLVVHRRCISPMYEIANRISYNGIMKQQTKLPSKEKIEKFCFPESQWINIKGKEQGKKNHFVKEQGDVVVKIIERAFEKSNYPDIYIISPFITVVREMRELMKVSLNGKKDANLEIWIDKNIGTVHTFQGKEADEVIFLLGCDTSKESEGAIKWVNANIVNVAVTRGKYRLYIVGEWEAWKKSKYISVAKELIGLFK